MNCIVVIASDTFCLSLKSVENLGEMGTRRELHKALPVCMQLLTASDTFSMTLLRLQHLNPERSTDLIISWEMSLMFPPTSRALR